MSTKVVNITGFAQKNEQFVVQARNFDVRFNNNVSVPSLDAPSPIEYILAGYAGCINAVGTLVAKELNLDLKSYNFVVVVKNYVYLSDGTQFEYTESRHRPDRFVFSDFARRR